MWQKVTADVKCPRGDCVFYDGVKATEKPCGGCSCNMKYRKIHMEFRYKSKCIPDNLLEEIEGRQIDEGRSSARR